MTGDKDQVAVRRALRIPLQIVVAVDRLAILIDAEDRHVQVVAGIGEVVRVAAEERRLLLGRKHQPHIGVLLVAIEPVFAAVVERHHVGAQTGLVGAFLFDRCDGRIARLQRGFLVGDALGRGIDLARSHSPSTPAHRLQDPETSSPDPGEVA